MATTTRTKAADDATEAQPKTPATLTIQVDAADIARIDGVISRSEAPGALTRTGIAREMMRQGLDASEKRAAERTRRAGK